MTVKKPGRLWAPGRGYAAGMDLWITLKPGLPTSPHLLGQRYALPTYPQPPPLQKIYFSKIQKSKDFKDRKAVRWISIFPAFSPKWITIFLASVDQYFSGAWITFFLTIAYINATIKVIQKEVKRQEKSDPLPTKSCII